MPFPSQKNFGEFGPNLICWRENPNLSRQRHFDLRLIGESGSCVLELSFEVFTDISGNSMPPDVFLKLSHLFLIVMEVFRFFIVRNLFPVFIFRQHLTL